MPGEIFGWVLITRVMENTKEQVADLGLAVEA